MKSRFLVARYYVLPTHNAIRHKWKKKKKKKHIPTFKKTHIHDFNGFLSLLSRVVSMYPSLTLA